LTLIRRALLILFLSILPAQIVPAAVPAHDWSKTVSRAPSGAFVLGNPAARVRLVEYLSLTCPHCAHFEAEGIGPLTAKYIRPGLVSYEVRHALRDAYDYTASLLARCDGPQAFFTTVPKVYARQDEWIARASSWAQTAQTEGETPDQLFPKLARGAGFDALFGMTPGRMDACIANQAERKLLEAQADEAWHRPGMTGTPAFMINGELQPDVGGWADLDAALAHALHARAAPTRHPLPGKTRRK
jgi:protein-disulfide isomerase